jgi:hypothetical protein
MLEILSPQAREGFARLVELRGSLPAIRRDIDLSGLSRPALEALGAGLAQARFEAARNSADAFIQYAIPHELTEEPIQNAPFHVGWHRFLDDHRLGVIIAPVEHGKTQQIAVGRILFTLGKNPNTRILLVSDTATQAEKILGLIAAHIERNPRIREVFPELKPSSRPRDKWTESQLTIERTSLAKEASVTAAGSGGPILGGRWDVIVLDDIHDLENTRTPKQLRKLLDWFETTVWTRLNDQGEGGRIWVIGTPWDPGDLLHVLGARPGWGLQRWSAVENPDDPQELWKPLWEAAWPRERLVFRFQNMLAHNWARKFLCRARSDTTGRFQEAWIAKALEAGQGRTFIDHAPTAFFNGPRLPCFTGVDIGVGEEEGHDLSSMVTIALDLTGKRIVVQIASGHWQAPEIVQRVLDVHYRFGSIVLVESNAAQKWISQWTAERGVAVVPFTTTGQNKWSEQFGVESLALELRAGLWVFPSGERGQDVPEEMRALTQEMLFYTPKGHTGDRLMATWLAREGARMHLGEATGYVDTQAR